MEIIGRLTADAKVNETRNGRQVVNFSIATNDNYKPKDSDEVRQVTTYFNCSYWINSRVAKALTKGKLAELYGAYKCKHLHEHSRRNKSVFKLSRKQYEAARKTNGRKNRKGIVYGNSRK